MPKNPKEQLELGAKIYAKHQADNNESALAGIASEWAGLGPQLAPALAAHERAEKLRKQMEDAYEERDRVAAKTLELTQRSRDILQGHYGAANVRKMGEHGFTVDDSPRAAKPAAVKAPKA